MIFLELLILAVLFSLSFFFSGSETILFSLTSAQRQRIRERDPAADARIGVCVQDSALLLSTLLVGNTLVNFAIATLGYRMFAAWIPGAGFIAIPVMTVGLLLLGEITPKQIALRFAEELAPQCARLLVFWLKILGPCNSVLKFTSGAFSKALTRERRALSDAELVSLLESGAEHGDFAREDAAMIEGVLRLSELCANDEMTPRVDMQVYDVDLPEEARAAALASGHHHFLPVVRRTPDVVEGVYDRKTGKTEDALFVPETVTLDDLLATFYRSGKKIAIVLDEYGGTAGLIALDDILELIFGPKVFTRQDNEPLIVKKGENVWEIDARASLDEINRELGIGLSAEDADRLSGWVAAQAERIPHVGQQVEADGCRATVLKRRRRRVISVRLEVLERPQAAVSDEEILAETDEAVERTEEDL